MDPTISKETDIALRTFLARSGLKKGDLRKLSKTPCNGGIGCAGKVTQYVGGQGV
jgi:hypothetical protein